MISAYCPGHITCAFVPEREAPEPLAVGSRGIGIRIAAGARVGMAEVPGDSVKVIIDGRPSEAPVTRRVLGALLPGRGLEVEVSNDLPVGQGFGMSAAGAVAAALCAAEIAGLDERAAWETAHLAEIGGGGGLGDVSGLYGRFDVPVRTRAGLPPAGEVVDSGISFDTLSVAVIGGPIDTGTMLADADAGLAIRRAGDAVLSRHMGDAGSLFAASNGFSQAAGIESPAVAQQISLLKGAGHHAGMCMLGNSIFSDCPAEEMERMFPHALVLGTSSTSLPPGITRSSRCV